ncbi:PHB depolymerase family esterase [Salinispirillum sp. LH 10-3-1]|uniref:PHB depolymerase family esterase n=1 Tax=Salinispirillum sp. LH 10-3-1 TaxID=2952525 RepID=A0AB38YCX4_9GAMM
MIQPVRWALALTMSLLMASLSSTVVAGTEYAYQFTQKSYPQSRNRNYTVYVPAGLTGVSPMVMALHGCRLTERDVLNDWGMKEAADRYGFILVTPFITSYNGLRNENCWGFWFNEHRHEGGGEVEDLVQIAKEVESNFSVDANRRFITGLSSGGAMAVVAAVAHNEYWAAAASAAGLPYGESASSVSLSGQCPGSATFHSISRVADDMQREVNDDYPIPMMVLQNERDCTVIPQAGRNIRDSWLAVFGDPDHNTLTTARADSSACAYTYQQSYSCVHERFTQDGTMNSRSVVETVFYTGPLATANPNDTDHGHYWIGGEDGNEGKWAVRQGPVYPDLIWDFFNRHARDASGAIDKPVVTLLGDNPMTLQINQPFYDPGASAVDPVEGSLPVNTTCDVNVDVDGTYYCTYVATNSEGVTGSAIRQVIVVDPNKPLETCVVESTSPVAHINSGRATAGGNYNLRALSSGDQMDIGFAWDSWSSVTLTEGEPGLWYTQQPEACQTQGGEPVPDPEPDPDPGFTCTQHYNTNLNHNSAGRAYYMMGYFTTGGNESLGGLSGVFTWVSEVSAGYYVAGQCPN